MKTQPQTLKDFVILLPQTWLQQFFLLGQRIKNVPRNKKARRVIAEICIGLMIAIPGALWAIHTGLCPNCDRQLGFGKSGRHLYSCLTCDDLVYKCPYYLHPHKVKCRSCDDHYFDCPLNPNRREVKAHGIAECLICEEPYKKCMADKIYCPESIIYPRHRPAAAKPKP